MAVNKKPYGFYRENRDLFYRLEGELTAIEAEALRVPPRKEEYEEPKIVERNILVTETLPRKLRDDFQTLKMVAPQVIGTIFERVGFLKERIFEINESLGLRKQMHDATLNEIVEDIKDKQGLLKGLSTINDKRDFMLDISNLRAEKRRENIQFWHDVTELNVQLRELLDEYRAEKKISDMFQELEG